LLVVSPVLLLPVQPQPVLVISLLPAGPVNTANNYVTEQSEATNADDGRTHTGVICHDVFKVSEATNLNDGEESSSTILYSILEC